ncbi:MAG TPA: hypothetical protein PKZ83_14285 [bacterium]|nr:hypothetical protein [bacterium]HQJ66079.1 hypothetical protein [bacterium]
MKLLSILFRLVNTERNTSANRRLEPPPPPPKRPLSLVGNIDANCPYCGSALKKKPGAKTKCPFCGCYIFVRTRPIDKKQVLVTQDEIEIIEEEWAIVNGTHEFYLAGKRERESIRDELHKKFGHPPDKEDIEWVRLNRQLHREARENAWGGYTSTRRQMAEALQKRNKLDHALRTYLEVCYLDLNGPQNCTVYLYKEANPRKEPRFLPKEGMLAIEIDQVISISKKNGITVSELKRLFFEIANKQHQNLRLPLSPEKAWELVDKQLRDAKLVE